MYLLTWIIADGTQKDGDLLLLQAYSLLSTAVMSELKSVDRGQRVEDASSNTWMVINSYYYLNFSKFAANFSDIYGIYVFCDVMDTPLNHGG